MVRQHHPKARLAKLPLWQFFVVLCSVCFACLGLKAAASSPSSENLPSGVLKTTQVLPLLYVKNVVKKILLSNYGKNQKEQLKGLAQIESILTRFASQPHNIFQAESLEEFHALRARMFPPVWDLQDEVQLLNKQIPPYIIIATQSEEVRAEMEQIVAEETTLHLPAILQFKPTTLEFAFRKITENPATAFSVFNLLPPKLKLEALSQFDSLLIAPQIDKIDHIGTLIAESGSVHLELKAWETFFQIVLGEYFSQLDLQTKLNMVAALADAPADADQMKLFSILVLNAGPQFQKFFQIYARQPGFSDSLKEVFIQLEQNTKPIPWRLVKTGHRRSKSSV